MSRWKWIGLSAVVAVYVMAVTYMAGKWAIRYAYLERGYDAVGGEYLFIPMVAWAAYKLINIFLNVLEDEMYAETGSEKTGGRGTAGIRDNR